jgi:Asp-tRNA(Asn)/Glu-tRNA(Gln) amidotransferase A subunit family amidase
VLANAAGCPAICLPVADGKGDLPASLQLIAAPRRDGELLSFARKVEQLLAQSA